MLSHIHNEALQIAQFGIDLPAPSSVPFTLLEWQDDAYSYFARLLRELPWTHFEASWSTNDAEIQ